MQVPEKNSENWKYHKLNFLQSMELTNTFSSPFKDEYLKLATVAAAYGAFTDVIVLFNGQFIEKASKYDSSKVKIEEKAADQFKACSSFDDVFNDAHNNEASTQLVFTWAKNIVQKSPLHVLHIFSPLTNGSADKIFGVYPQIRLKAGEGAEMSLVESFIATADIEYFCNSSLLAHLEANSCLTYVSYHNHAGSAVATHRLRFQQEKDSQLRTTTVSLGQKLLRNDMLIEVSGQGANCIANGLYLANEGEMIDNHTEIRHVKGFNTSHQMYKGILTGNAKAVFNGKIYIAKDSQQVDSSQVNKNLLLSKKAQINTKPELEIYADDVKANHGATVGQMDPEQLFYMQARGISPEVAKPLLAKGFVDEVLLQVGGQQTSEHLQNTLAKKLDNFLGGLS